MPSAATTESETTELEEHAGSSAVIAGPFARFGQRKVVEVGEYLAGCRKTLFGRRSFVVELDHSHSWHKRRSFDSRSGRRMPQRMQSSRGRDAPKGAAPFPPAFGAGRGEALLGSFFGSVTRCVTALLRFCCRS